MHYNRDGNTINLAFCFLMPMALACSMSVAARLTSDLQLIAGWTGAAGIAIGFVYLLASKGWLCQRRVSIAYGPATQKPIYRAYYRRAYGFVLSGLAIVASSAAIL